MASPRQVSDTPPNRLENDEPDTAGASRRLVLVGLVAILTWLSIDLVKASGPMEDFGFSKSIAMAALISIGTYLLPAISLGVFLAIAVLQRSSQRAKAPAMALWWIVLAVAVARFALQLISIENAFLLGLATVGLAIGALILAASVLSARPGGAFDTALAVGIGGALAVFVSGAFGSWDPIWQPGPIALAVVVVQVCAAAALAWMQRNEPSQRPNRKAWVLGPYLGVATMTFLNPAFLASQGGIGYGWATRIVALATASAVLALLLLGGNQRRWPNLVSGIVLLAAIAWSYLAKGLGVALATFAACLSASIMLAAALTARPRPEKPVASTDGASNETTSRWTSHTFSTIAGVMGVGAVAGLFIVLTQLLFQLDYDAPLPFPNWCLPLAAMFALVIAAWQGTRTGNRANDTVASVETRPATTSRGGRALIGAIAAASLVATLLTAPDLDPKIEASAPAELTVLDWNLHYSVAVGPGIELEEIAATIEDSGAGVAMLQEVNRGWVFGSSTDTAEWLARRLNMTYAWAPAADGQFGNLILSRYQLADIATTSLPFGDGPQLRSAVSATVVVGAEPVRFTSVHLQHRDENSWTRTKQIMVLLAAEDHPGPSVIGGDMNAYPEWEELELFDDESYLSAQDLIGDPTAFTSPTNPATNRIDYIFGRSIDFTSFEIGTSQASDHFPLIARLRVQ